MSETAAAAGILADEWVIEPRRHGLFERLRELWQYRRLWWFFASDTMAGLYGRTQLGWLWLTLRASGPVGLNAVVFGGIVEIDSEGVPYFLFLLCGMTTWILFERSLLFVTRSLERNRQLLKKIYFPRLILPMSAVAPGLMFLGILLLVMVATVIYFHHERGVWYITIRPELLASVLAIVMSLVFTIAVGLWTSVLQARYRDIRYGLRYVMPFWLYFTPVLYPTSIIPERWRWIVTINPMSHVVQLFKWGTLGVDAPSVIGVFIAFAVILLTMIAGLWFFSREEAASIDKL